MIEPPPTVVKTFNQTWFNWLNNLYNYVRGIESGANIEVEDEGTSLTTSVSKINFVGVGVTATEPVADEITVTIPGGGTSYNITDNSDATFLTVDVNENATFANDLVAEGNTFTLGDTALNKTVIKSKATPAVQPGGSTTASIITNDGTSSGAFHIGIELPANDANDSFYVTTDTDLNGTPDFIALRIKPEGGTQIFGDVVLDAKSDHTSTVSAGNTYLWTKSVSPYDQLIFTNDSSIDIPLNGETQSAVTTTSGTTADFTGIPIGVRQITVNFDAVSLSGTDEIIVQLGDNGGFETSGYVGGSSLADGSTTPSTNTSTTGLLCSCDSAASTAITGSLILTRKDQSSTIWVAQGNFFDGGSGIIHSAGKKQLTTGLNRIRITRTGSDTFDAGSVSVTY